MFVTDSVHTCRELTTHKYISLMERECSQMYEHLLGLPKESYKTRKECNTNTDRQCNQDEDRVTTFDSGFSFINNQVGKQNMYDKYKCEGVLNHMYDKE